MARKKRIPGQWEHRCDSPGAPAYDWFIAPDGKMVYPDEIEDVLRRLQRDSDALAELRQFHGRMTIGIDHVREDRRVVTDGVLYEKKYPLAFAALAQVERDANS